MSQDFFNLPQTTRLLIVGDLNMEFNNAFERNFEPLLNMGFESSLQQGNLTTLRKNELIDGTHLAKQVDYVFHKNVTIKNREVEDFAQILFRNFDNSINIEEANKVSDHLPINVRLEIPDSFPQNFKLATWRIRSFSTSSRDNRELLTIRQIARKYDFLAIQDVQDEEVIQRLVQSLNGTGVNYDFEVKLPYAFIWNSQFIKQLAPARIIEREEFQRNPCYSLFKAGNFDFVVLTHHTTTKSLSDTNDEIRLLPSVYQEVQNRFPNENDIIVGGCFSRAPRFSDWEGLLGISPKMEAVFEEPLATNISDTDIFDNFYWDNPTELGITEIDKFDEEFFENDADANRAVSSNRPCWMQIEMTEDND